MFPKDFVWGVASSAYQVEGTDPDDGRGKNVWDEFVRSGRVYEQQTADVSCDHMHRYKEDFALMRLLGIKNYRFSLSWSRILPAGTGKVNGKAVQMYRDMILCMKENGIRPFITMFHWEFPYELFKKGGWLNEDVVEWFGEYAKVVAENFSDLCTDFITINEPQCAIGLGHLSGVHAPGMQYSVPETFQMAHNLMKAHGQAVINLRKYAKQKIRVGYAPTCGVAYPASEGTKDIEAAKKVYFGFDNPMDNWTWNVAWFSDPVFLGEYPKEGLEKFAPYLPEITKEDMELIHQPLDFMGQNIYNGYMIRCGKDGKPEYVDRAPGAAKTGTGWPVTPEALYYGIRFLTERYHLPLYITENGMSDLDNISADGQVHDSERITFLDAYLGAVQRAVNEGMPVIGYFLWTFLDNFEWAEGYKERFGLVYVDYTTQRRIAKDSAYWYKEVMRMNGENLSCNQPCKEILFMNPVFTHNIWGGTKLREEFGYAIEGDDIGECWGIAAHPNGTCTIADGAYKGKKLSDLWEEHKELFGNTQGKVFPLLIKIIDAKADLSIQVHPDDTYAAEHENGSLGKMECWYILDCEPDSKLVIGHNAKTHEELEDMVHNGRWSELIREVPVKKGDFIQIDPGTVHAIKGGITILETQQNSDITYRVYDYDRLSNGKPRQLHVQQSLDVIKVPAAPMSECMIETGEAETNKLQKLIECKYYQVFHMKVVGKAEFEQSYPFLIVSVVEGNGLLNHTSVKKGDHFILPCGYGNVEIEGNLELVASTVSTK